MDEKGKLRQEKKSHFRTIGVVLFLLISGLWYSQAYHNNDLLMGTPTTIEEAQTAAEEEKKILLNGVVDKIDLNTADEKELVRLPGVGEKTAAAILAYREENGAFATTAEIMEVSGIGKKKYEKMKNYITVDCI